MTIQKIADIADVLLKIFLVLGYGAKVGGFIDRTAPFLQAGKQSPEKSANEFSQEQRPSSEEGVLLLIARAFLGVSLYWFIFAVLVFA